MSQKVGFVGVGRMGANMARRLKDCGYDVSAVYDIRSEAATELATELGTTAASTLAQVTELSDVIITVVIDDASMHTIFASEGDSLLTGAEGRVFINCATISPAVHIEVEALAKAAGAESLEGCMASSITQARDGTLYLMLGGDKATYEKVEELLGKLSGNKRHIGEAGKAAQVKALVNMVMNINTAGSWRFSPRPAPIPACSRPMARTCATATMSATSPARTPQRIQASRWHLAKQRGSTSRWPPPPRGSSTK